MTRDELLQVIADVRQALAVARASVEFLEGSPRRRADIRDALDRIGSRTANLIDVATGAVTVED